MKIDGATFGSITIDDKTYDHDVLIRLSEKVEKRKKELSERIFSLAGNGMRTMRTAISQRASQTCRISAGRC